MYKEIFKPLSKAQIKLLNHSGLAEAFNCSHTYVSRILKSKAEPNAPKAKNILNTAKELVEKIETNAAKESARQEQNNKS